MATEKSTDSTGSAFEKVTTQDSTGTCFVLMPFGGYFDLRFKNVYKPAIGAANLSCIRADSLFGPSPIMSDIWKNIQSSGPLLADMTGQNANVFYELGLAHAIGKPVVLVSETMDDVPFDLRPYRVITFDKNEPSWGAQLQKAITASLEETMREPIGQCRKCFEKSFPVRRRSRTNSARELIISKGNSNN